MDNLVPQASLATLASSPRNVEHLVSGLGPSIRPTTGPALPHDNTTDVPLEPHEVGMTVGYKQFYAGKEDKQGRFKWQTEVPQDIGKPAEDSGSSKWAIVVCRRRVYNNPKKVLAIHSIAIHSPLIKDILRDVLKGYPGVTVPLKHLKFSGRFEPLIHRWPALRKAIADLETRRDQGDVDNKIDNRIAHAKLLDDLLVDEFSEIEEAMTDMQNNSVITFEHLWTVFPPQSLVFFRQHHQAVQLLSATYDKDNNGSPIFCLTCAYVDFDGRDFGIQRASVTISEFKGTKPFRSLSAFPLQLHDKLKEVTAKLIERGRKFEALAGTNYRSYKGVACWLRGPQGGPERFTVKGRIVVDPLGFNRFQPDLSAYVSYSLPTTNFSASSLPPSNIFGTQRQSNTSWGNLSCMLPMDLDVDACEDDDVPADVVFDDDKQLKKLRKLTNQQRLICTPFVRGYSLKDKKWLTFFVNGVSDITFNEGAFSALNLPNNQKDLILGFTSAKHLHGSQFDDVIEGKGKGIIILLSGPPGVGKTLTAESVAEQMKAPLYVMAAGDLGLDPSTVENKLGHVMSICSRWGAILLLDEADVFLEQRDLHQLERNKLVSIFLRVLEYYEGIMFLTTNRVQTFDEAFQSRIHISLEYAPLDKKSRKGIWHTFLTQHNAAQAAAREKSSSVRADSAAVKTSPKRSADDSAMDTDGNVDTNQPEEDLGLVTTQPHKLSDRHVARLADIELNGRQIKNFLKTARLLAIYKKEPLSYHHVETVIAETQHLHQATQATKQSRAGIFN